MLFGISNSKFITGATTVELLHSLLDPDYFIPDEVEHTSIINGDVNYIWRGQYNKFLVTVYLFKYSDPKAKFLEIYSYKGTSVDYFYPFSDGEFIKDLGGNAVKFHISEVLPYYLTQDAYYDAVRITFNPIKYSTYEDTPSPFGYGYNYGMYYGWGL